MPTEQQVRETIDRCVSAMTRYHDGERMSRREATMAAEVGVPAADIMGMGADPAEADARIFRVVERELQSRYGNEVRPRLFFDFLCAFAEPIMAREVVARG